MGTICGRVNCLLSSIAVVTTCLAGLAQAEGAALNDENREAFQEVYKIVRGLDRIVEICTAADVDTRVDNRAIMDSFMAKTSLDQTRPVLEEIIEAHPDLKQRLDSEIENELVPFKEQLASFDICGAEFEGMLIPAEVSDVDAFMQFFVDGVVLDQAIAQPDGKAAEGREETRDVQTLAAEDSPLDIELVTITSGNYPHFSDVYNTVGSIDWLSDVCAQEAPESAAHNQDIIASLIPDQRLGQIRSFLDATIQGQPEIQTDLNAAFEQQAVMLQKAFGHSMEIFCRQRFEPMVAPQVEALPDASTFAQTLASTAADAPEVQIADAPATPAESTASVAATGALPMPRVSGEFRERLPGLAWQLPDGVVADDGFGSKCPWRCTVFHYRGDKFPLLSVHEAVPLSAEEAVDAVIATLKHPVAEQVDLDMSKFLGLTSLRPDRLISRDVYVQRGERRDLYWLIAFEKNGLTVVAEFSYPARLKGKKASVESEALTQLVMSLNMDVDAVHASLTAPAVPFDRPSTDAPPRPDQIIYAQDPSINYKTKLVGSYDGPVTSFNFDTDARVMDLAVLEREGPALDIDGEIFEYRPRQPEGTLMEGAFESPERYQVFGIDFDLLNGGRRLAFNRNGRFGIVQDRAYRDGLVSTDHFSQDIGTYRIHGYMIELRADSGAVQQELFFRYDHKINFGGKVLYPIPVTK